jgi:uncharacterized membrane protein
VKDVYRVKNKGGVFYMGLFFEKRESTKPFIILRILMLVILGVIVLTILINGFDFLFLRLAFILAGIMSVIDGVESYLKKENKWRHLSDLGVGLLWFITAFIF